MTETELQHDRTHGIVRANFARILLLAVAGTVLCDPAQIQRLVALLHNRKRWGQPPPLVMVGVHRDVEQRMFERFQRSPSADLARFIVVRQADHSELVGNAVKVFRDQIDPNADDFSIKRQTLFLTRRGGKGTPQFVSPFTGGAGTTCGTWTPVVDRKPDGTIYKGFLKAALINGFCPVGCPYCFLQGMIYTEGMDVALNWEDLADELRAEYSGCAFPINFGETSGLVEYDEWFFNGRDGSIIQYVIDACAAADVTPFFLTKIRYPRYIKFNGKVQVGISLMPEPIREWMAPHGSPADELLGSLAWAVSNGACDPVIRMTVAWTEREHYPDLLRQCRELLGPSGWRLTLDILRFTPTTALRIKDRYPELAQRFAAELSPGDTDLALLVSRATEGTDHVKKIRPSIERQTEIYSWFRDELNRLGCQSVMVTPCKGDPDELLQLVKDGIIDAMPCACHRDTPKPGTIALPFFTAAEPVAEQIPIEASTPEDK